MSSPSGHKMFERKKATAPARSTQLTGSSGANFSDSGNLFQFIFEDSGRSENMQVYFILATSCWDVEAQKTLDAVRLFLALSVSVSATNMAARTHRGAFSVAMGKALDLTADRAMMYWLTLSSFNGIFTPPSRRCVDVETTLSILREGLRKGRAFEGMRRQQRAHVTFKSEKEGACVFARHTPSRTRPADRPSDARRRRPAG